MAHTLEYLSPVLIDNLVWASVWYQHGIWHLVRFSLLVGGLRYVGLFDKVDVLAGLFIGTLLVTGFRAWKHGTFLFFPCDLSQLAMFPPQSHSFATGLAVCSLCLYARHHRDGSWVGMVASMGLFVAGNWDTLHHFTVHCLGAAVGFGLYTCMILASPRISVYSKGLLVALFASRLILSVYRLWFGSDSLVSLGLFPGRDAVMKLYSSPEYRRVSAIGSPLQWATIVCILVHVFHLLLD